MTTATSASAGAVTTTVASFQSNWGWASCGCNRGWGRCCGHRWGRCCHHRRCSHRRLIVVNTNNVGAGGGGGGGGGASRARNFNDNDNEREREREQPR
ncbi:hypothetical protein [Streptosporangium sp. NPDC006007]|uniref:hypothetical protein n=1 Tax=Streptosporangium sp. NPDC006007 TaxID=3154575 RepID=UPI0033BBAA1F